MAQPLLSRDGVRGFTRRSVAAGLLGGALAVAVVSLVIAALDATVDSSALTGLYLFAILPVAIGWGFWPAGIVALAAFVVYDFFFERPYDSLVISRPEGVAALLIAVVTAYVVSDLARRAHLRAGEAQARAREADEAQRIQRRLAEEHAALRRVATLVARSAPTTEVFEAVTGEVGLLCGADLARMERFEVDGSVTGIASWTRGGQTPLAVGTRFALEGASIAAQVRETGQPARVDSFVGAEGPIAREAQALGIGASVGCPIRADGRLWGVIAASTTGREPFPPETESRIDDFTELVATAISNAEARAELIASRERLLAAGDEARRRVVRDLHDGAQRRFVHATLTLDLALRALPDDVTGATELITEAIEHARAAHRELRELAHGLLPDVLTEGGLAAGVDSIVAGLRVPVEVSVPDDRFPSAVESSAYFVVAEALTNMAKHSEAQHASVGVRVENGSLRIDVRDDGIGGARPDGRGLLGLRDRVATLGGHFEVDSPPAAGTRVAVSLPLRR